MNAKQLFYVSSVTILLAAGYHADVVHGQGSPRLVGLVEMTLSDGRIRNVAIDNTGRLLIRSDGFNDPPTWNTGWVMSGQLPAGTPTSIRLASGAAFGFHYPILVTMENGDVYGVQVLTDSPSPAPPYRIQSELFGNVFGGSVQVGATSWSTVKGSFRK